MSRRREGDPLILRAFFCFQEVRRDMDTRVASQESPARDLPGRPNDQWLQAIFGQAAVGIAVIDGEGHFLHCNQKLAQITGRTVAELIGIKCSEVTHPDDWPASQAMMQDLRSGLRTEFSAEKRYLRPDDAVVWVNVAVSPLRDTTGRFDRLIAVVEDITARKRAEQAVQEREHRVRRVLERMPAGTYLCDRHGLITYFNHHAEALWGRAPKLNDPIDRYCGSFKLFAADGTPIDHSECWMALALRNETAYDGKELIIERPDGKRVTVLAHANPIWGDNDELIGAVNVLVDISDRKHAEQSLRESEDRFRHLADNVPVLIWLSGPDGYEFVNREYLKFAGCDFSRLRGTGWQDLLHPADAPGFFTAYDRACRESQPFAMQLRFRRADGEYRWLRLTAVPRLDDDGQLLGFVGCSADITDIKRSEESLREADQRKDEFLATLAHELRNPLAPIRNSLRILRVGTDEESVGKVHDMLERQVDQMVRLVDDLLEVSRITRGKIELRRERVELGAVIRDALETSKPLIDAGRHELTVGLTPEPLWLDADPIRLAQVFSNLLNNAAKYTEPGGRIWVNITRQGDHVVVSVCDTGIGIAPEKIPKVFNLFAQIDTTTGRALGGLGIGLALARRLVEMHGGRIDARSGGPGEGSEFRVHLPLASEQDSGSRKDRRHSDPKVGSPSQHRVMVVDDNRDAAESLGMLLRLRAMQVHVAHDGPSALRAMPTFHPTVILLDLGMPGMDGYEVAEQIRKEPEFADVILIALTGWGHAEFRERSRDTGFAFHLVKPVELEALLSLLGSLRPAAERPSTERGT
jgi:PAS domain S-box-containing protein